MAKGILDMLVASGDLDLKDASEAKRAAKNKDISLEEELSLRGISDEKIMKAKGDSMGLPVYFFDTENASFDLLKLVPEETAKRYQFVPVGMEGETVLIGMVDPDSIESREALKFIASRLNQPFKILLISKKDFDKVIGAYKGISGEVSKVLGELEIAMTEDEKTAVRRTRDVELERAENVVEDAPITKMVAVILRHATEGKASDIHIEPTRDNVRVRFRVDGVLHTSLILPITVHEAVVSRVKILTNLQLDEKRRPQDGRFSTNLEGRKIDFRVSTFPTFFGEKVAIRILDPETGIKSVEGLGLEKRNAKFISDALSRPYGLILVTGPTGSGKSTTLYSMLQEINEEKWNIVSLEDPVEYSIDGLNQSQVRPEIGYDFAQGIRHILRQDPDIMMVGEIRDEETAKLAIHAALTGHLVFSTLHTNTAAGVIPRLIDMGVDPYLIAPTLIMAVGQRLVRQLCEDSKEEVEVSGNIKERLTSEVSEMPEAVKKEVKIPSHIYRAKSSASCPKGTKGRAAIFEVLNMNPKIQELILAKPSEEQVMEEARKSGMTTMRQDGILKVFKGEVGLEELLEII